MIILQTPYTLLLHRLKKSEDAQMSSMSHEDASFLIPTEEENLKVLKIQPCRREWALGGSCI